MASRFFDWHLGQIHYQKRGMGDPLLLVHNIYPGASHEEFNHNLDALSRRFTVYALDLMGFGESDTPRLKYTAGMYINLVGDFVYEVIRERTHVMSSGLSCAYVTAAAARWKNEFGRMVFVCPRSEPTGLDMPRWIAPIRHFMLTAPGLGRGYYETVAGEYGIREYLRNSFYNRRAVTPDLVQRLLDNAWRPGAILAYASLITGYLDHSLLAVLPRMRNPIMLVWGRQAKPTPMEHSVRLLALAPNSRLEVVENAGSWVHDEQSAAVDRLVLGYLNDELPQPATAKIA